MLNTVTVKGVDFDVYYDLYIERDMYGTGDSPTGYTIDIMSIELATDTKDIQEVLAEDVLCKIEDQLIEDAKMGGYDE